MNINIVFMGSPDFSLPSLRYLAESNNVVGVITQPDRPAGRGRTLTPPPVKILAEELNLPVFQPERLRAPESFEKLASWKPDLIVVTAYGQILRQNVLSYPKFGCINVHASLLPRWRGAAPIQAAILHGDQSTGVTIMKMDAGIDTGPMLASEEVEILPGETAGELSDRLAEKGGKLLVNVLPDYLAGILPPIPQPEDGATYAGMIAKEEGRLDFSQPAEVLALRVRGFNPWPTAFMEWQSGLLKIHRARVSNQPGYFPEGRNIIEGYPAVGTSSGWLILEEVQPAGKKPMPGKVFLAGARNWAN
jgi:methionyl-tRNA formyltransferase